MDLTPLLNTLLSANSLNAISRRTDSSSGDVSNVLAAALPSLLSGANEQANLSGSGFEEALSSHAKSDTSDVSSFLSNVDLTDGGKIIGHLLGGNTDSLLGNISKKSGVSKSQTSSILSAAAPLLLSLLGQETQKSKKSKSSGLSIANLMGSLLGSGSSNVDLTSLALSALAGAVNTNPSKGATKKKTSASTKAATSAKKKTTTTTKKKAATTTAKKTAASSATTTKKKAATSTAKKKAAPAKKTSAKSGINLSDGIGADDVLGVLGKLLK